MRSEGFYKQVCVDLSINTVIDMGGSPTLALHCARSSLDQKHPRQIIYLGYCRNPEHQAMLERHVDAMILRELSQEDGPFYHAEMARQLATVVQEGGEWNVGDDADDNDIGL